MRRHRTLLQILLPALGIAALILDGNTALTAARNAIELCTRTVIPSLFPFFLLSILLTNALGGINIQLLKPLGKLCHIPEGTESLFIIGLLGGYPTGAQAIAESYRYGRISKGTAERLLGFCSNAGPAFIFGIMGNQFHSNAIPWLLWSLHITSAIIVGAILPHNDKLAFKGKPNGVMHIQIAFKKALVAIAGVCGWILLFKVLIAFMDRWFLWLLPQTISISIIGLLELANGAFALSQIGNDSMRFILSSLFLSFGGVCVGMQTISVTADLRSNWYFKGKLLQSTVSFTLASVISMFLLEPLPYQRFYAMCGLICSVIFVLVFQRKKLTVAFSQNWVYNSQKQVRELR